MVATIIFEDLITAATDGDWKLVDQHITAHDKPENLKWALEVGIKHSNRDLRDLAATFLDVSDRAIDPRTLQSLERRMWEDDYEIVRYRLAIALWKRDYRTQVVNAMMQSAMNNPDVGKIARQHYAK